MLTGNTRLAVVVAALSLAAFALQPATAEAAKKGGKAARDAMIQECLMKVNKEAGPLQPGESGERRTEIYKSCMVSAGFRP